MSVHDRDPASFRDPAGYVEDRDGKIVRILEEGGVKQTQLPGWREFIDHADFIPSRFISDREIEMDRVPVISYPYEWSPAQLRDAALLTLNIQKEALGQNLSLKDASAFNVQFIGCKPVFIDHLSIESNTQRAWIAYRQFCEHFFGPLALSALISPELATSLWNGIDGIDIRTCSSLLGKRGRFQLAVQLHIHRHASVTKSSGEPSRAQNLPEMPLIQQLGSIDHLERSVRGFKFDFPATTWTDYYATTNYSIEAANAKEEAVEKYLNEGSFSRVVDLGANDGKFSRIAANYADTVVAIESDISLVNQMYLDGSERILPLWMDLSNPTAGRGFLGTERKSIFERAQGDSVLALAVIHHLVFRNQVPLHMVIELIARFGQCAVIEWIEPDDSYVQRLIGGRTSGLQRYDREEFERCIGLYFEVETTKKLADSKRTLYFVKRR